MVVRDLFNLSDDVRVIARTVFEERCKPQEVDPWITKYYALLMELKSSKIRKSRLMLFLNVVAEERITYGVVSGISYKDIKAENEDCYLAIEDISCGKYASLYVPDYMIQCYGIEVIASEALRLYGWNNYKEEIKCPEEIRHEIHEILPEMKHEIFPIGGDYQQKCMRQFRKAYEGKKVPQWEYRKEVIL